MVTHRRRSSGAGPRALTAARGLRRPTPRKAEHPTVAAGYPNLPTAEQPNATDRAPSRVQPPVAPTPRQTRTLRRAFQPSAVIQIGRASCRERVVIAVVAGSSGGA